MAILTPVPLRRCCGYRNRRNYMFAFMILVSLPFLYFHFTFPVRYIFKNDDYRQACIIPKLNPWDSSILQYIWDLKPLVCDTSPGILFLDDKGTIHYNTTAFQLLNIKESSVKCQYKTLIRHLYDDLPTFTSAVPFTPPIQVESEFVHVTCVTESNTQIFDELFASIRRNISAKFLPESKDQLSIVLFGLDSVSRSHSIRKLPKTVKYLKEQLKAYDFQGYMKVGENTFPNLLALTTGRRHHELPVTDLMQQPYDSCPFIWKNCSSRGYATLYAEDRPDYATFSYYAKGFKNPPTNHYMHPFWQAINELDKLGKTLTPVFQFLESRHVHLKSSALCYGRKAKHMAAIDYVKQFFRTYPGTRRFAFSFINELCHEFPNFLGYGDDDILSLFKWMQSDGHLNNTVLVFFSDHGSRIDKIRNTVAGRIEDRMPMMYIVLPEHIRNKFPELDKSMKTNTERLVTTFDLYQTLMDIVTQKFKEPSKHYVNNTLRGISLFQPIPVHRSCADAFIPENFCACYSSSPVNTTGDGKLTLVANTMVTNINDRLSRSPSCAHLELFKIHTAELISQGLKHYKTENTGISLLQFFKPDSEPSRRYLVVIETIPGHGVFEGTADINSAAGSVAIVGDIVRINKYGNQGHCMQDKLLRPLCYCKEQITEITP